jgi:hypothetical protein
MAELYQVSGGGGLAASGEYNPGNADEIDRVIRNMPAVVQHITKKAHELLSDVGSSNFEVVLSYSPDGGQQRARAYVCPSNNQGIHEELSQAVLLKAALGMAGR